MATAEERNPHAATEEVHEKKNRKRNRPKKMPESEPAIPDASNNAEEPVSGEEEVADEREVVVSHKEKKKKRNRPKKVPKESEPAPSVTTDNDEDFTREEEEHEDVVAEDRGEEVDEEMEGAESHKEKKKAKKSGSGIMSTESFSCLGLSEPTMKAINDMGFVNMTQVCHGKFGFGFGFGFVVSYGSPVWLFRKFREWTDKKIEIF